jgi:O-antigen/teichoic acid export membrane protein
MGTIVNKLSLLVFFSMLARKLGVAGLGDFYLLITLSGLFTILANFGFDVLTVREIARDHNKLKWFYPNVGIIKVGISLITVGLTYIYLVLGHYSHELIGIGAFSAFMTLFMSNMNHLDSIYRGLEKFGMAALIQIVNGVLVLLGGILAIEAGGELKEVIILMVIAYAVTSIIFNMLLSITSKVSPIALDFAPWKSVIHDAYPFMLTSALAILYYRLDTILLSQFAGDRAVGIYGAAGKIIENYGVIPTIFVSSIFPLMARQFGQSAESLKKTANLALKYLLIVSLPISAFSVFDAAKIIHLFYGNGFNESILPYQVLCVRAFSIFVTTLLGYLLFSANRQKLYMQFSTFTIVVNVALNVVLIPRFSYMGPPLAIAASTLVSVTFHVYFARKYVCKIDLWRPMLKPLLASVPVALFLFFSPLGIFADIAIATLIYGLAALAVGLFDKYDVSVLRAALSFQGSRA